MDIVGHSAALGSRHISAGRTGGRKIFLESSSSFENAESNETRSTGVLVSDTHWRCSLTAHLPKCPLQKQAFIIIPLELLKKRLRSKGDILNPNTAAAGR